MNQPKLILAQGSLKVRLAIMMFLQFFIWGAWYGTGGNYMNSHGMSNVIYLAFTASSIGSVISPFFLGMIADRFFPVQKVLGIMHIISGIFIFCAPFFGEGQMQSTTLFLICILLHMLCYMPTVNLAAATAFHLLRGPEQHFPAIRLFGTLGWIAAGILVSRLLSGDTTGIPMRVSGVAALIMGLYSFSLPNIPPKSTHIRISFRAFIGADVFAKIHSRSFYIFIFSLLLISLPFAIYFPYVPVFLGKTGVENPGFTMTFGQVSEIAFLLILPFFFKKYGLKWVLLTGMVAWAIRYALFAIAAPEAVTWMILLGIIIHGCCYDFVYVAGQIYIDRNANPEIRAQAQGLFVLVSYGVGQGLGTLGAGWLYHIVMTENNSLREWQLFWTIPFAFSALVSLLFMFCFKEKIPASSPAGQDQRIFPHSN
ncbi:MAG TPA: MFS transporter [Puia sp.]|nr:MFS transporter [Puia sp.]